MIIDVIFIIFLLSGGITSIAYFVENLDAYNEIEDSCDQLGLESICDTLVQTFASEIAAAVSSYCIVKYRNLYVY